jgi:hypothetical protein
MQLELQIDSSTDFPRKYGKTVKDLGGKYSECRGDVHRRIVHVPAEAVKLADKIAAEHSRPESLVVIVRVGHREKVLKLDDKVYRGVAPSVALFKFRSLITQAENALQDQWLPPHKVEAILKQGFLYEYQHSHEFGHTYRKAPVVSADVAVVIVRAPNSWHQAIRCDAKEWESLALDEASILAYAAVRANNEAQKYRELAEKAAAQAEALLVRKQALSEV